MERISASEHTPVHSAMPRCGQNRQSCHGRTGCRTIMRAVRPDTTEEIAAENWSSFFIQYGSISHTDLLPDKTQFTATPDSRLPIIHSRSFVFSGPALCIKFLVCRSRRKLRQRFRQNSLSSITQIHPSTTTAASNCVFFSFFLKGNPPSQIELRIYPFSYRTQAPPS